MKKIKVGIAGTRGMSTLMGLNSIEDVEITAVCDLDEGHLQDIAKKTGVEKIYIIKNENLEKYSTKFYQEAVIQTINKSG